LSDLLFVYGTLRPGAAMHGLIEGRVTVIGAATVPGSLVDLGAFPALVEATGPGERVHGALCEIPHGDLEALFDVLDRYEGETFERLLDEVSGPRGAAQAWLYRWRGDPTGRRRVPGGDYLAKARPVR
jgi:gamma-glutamylcyclotransferase (GGCT)/AIG2-like uncharacterized protein YtfP